MNELEKLEQKLNISKYVKFNISYSKQRQNGPSDLRVQKSCWCWIIQRYNLICSESWCRKCLHNFCLLKRVFPTKSDRNLSFLNQLVSTWQLHICRMFLKRNQATKGSIFLASFLLLIYFLVFVCALHTFPLFCWPPWLWNQTGSQSFCSLWPRILIYYSERCHSVIISNQALKSYCYSHSPIHSFQ